MTDVDATLVVDDGAGGSRALSIDDFKAAATGDATQTTAAAILAKLSADPATQTTLAAALVQLVAIAGSVDGLEGFTDGIEGKLDTVHTDLAAIDGHVDGLEGAFTTLNAKDFATQTTLAAVLAKLSADPATQTTLAAILAKMIAAPATEAKQDTQATKLDTLHTDLVALQGYVDGLEGKDYATQATLAALLAKVIAAPSTEAKQDALIALLPAALSSGRFKVEATPTSGATFSVESSTVSKTYQQLTSTAASATIASLCSGAALPSGATKMLCVPTAAVRFRDDGTNPTASVGLPVQASQPFTYDGDLLSALKVYGAATLDCWFYA